MPLGLGASQCTGWRQGRGELKVLTHMLLLGLEWDGKGWAERSAQAESGESRTSREVTTVQKLLQAQGFRPHAHQAHIVLVQEGLEVAEVLGDPTTHHAAEASQTGHHTSFILP